MTTNHNIIDVASGGALVDKTPEAVWHDQKIVVFSQV